MTEYHSVKAFAREEPRIELIEATLRSLLSVVELEYEGEPVKVDGFRLRDLEDWRTAPDTSLQLNLGSLSTACNCRCEFCYEDGNPPGLFAREPRFVGLQEACTRARYLRDGRGLPRESKGFFEPLMNPDFLGLMSLARQHVADELLEITTNGALLDERTIRELAGLMPVWVNLSLNSSDPAVRRAVMGDRSSADVVRVPGQLRSNGIPFMGSIVPWPQQGLDDLRRTIEFLDASEALAIRIAMPALTRHHPQRGSVELDAWLPEVKQLVQRLRGRVNTPVLISPFTHVTSSTDAIVEGVVRRSPADEAGIEIGDRILAVNEKRVVSRAHALSLLESALSDGAARLDIARGDARLGVDLQSPSPAADLYPYQPRGYRPLDFPGMLFGLCLPGSFHLAYVKRILESIIANGASRPLVLVSAPLRAVVSQLLAGVPLPGGAEPDLLVPESRFFGGDVNIGDLWVLEDIAESVRTHAREVGWPDLLIMPSSFLSRWGRDLRGVPYTELGRALGLEVSAIPCERIFL